jgi:hypothetical protein
MDSKFLISIKAELHMMHSETPGMMIDQIVNNIKKDFMNEEVNREDAL